MAITEDNLCSRCDTERVTRQDMEESYEDFSCSFCFALYLTELYRLKTNRRNGERYTHAPWSGGVGSSSTIPTERRQAFD